MNLNTSLFLFALIGVPIVWIAVTYNRFIDLRQHIRSAWAGIDVELKRRHDLIPQLVSVVKGYAEYESETFKGLVEARNKAIAGNTTPATAAAAESGLMRELQQFFVQVEAYPQLRANQQYAALQRELAETEDRIAAARRLYNGNVRDWCSLRDGFPSLLVGRMFGLAAENHEFFELTSAAERVVPRVSV